MPIEIKNENDFIELSKVSKHCRVKRLKDIVKLKLRTNKYLYTFKTTPQKAEELVKKINCQVIEL